MLSYKVSKRHSIGTTSVQYAPWFLKDMAEEVNQVIIAICEEQYMLSYKVSQCHSIGMTIESASL